MGIMAATSKVNIYLQSEFRMTSSAQNKLINGVVFMKIEFNCFRTYPPTDEELKRNLAIMEMKKLNAAELDAKYSDGKEKDKHLEITTGLSDFPKYKEYETVVGKRPEKKDDDNKQLT